MKRLVVLSTKLLCVAFASAIMAWSGTALAFDLQSGETRLSGADLSALIVGTSLSYTYSNALGQSGVETYLADKTFTVRITTKGRPPRLAENTELLPMGRYALPRKTCPAKAAKFMS